MIFGIGLISLIAVYYEAVYQHVPTKIIVLVSVLNGSIIIGISVAGYVLEVLSGFAIFTIIMVLVWLVLLGASTALAIQKYNRQDEAPQVFSAYGYPHYRFESTKEELKSNMNHSVIFSFSMVTLIIYAVVVSIFFTSKDFAIYALSFFIIIDFFVQSRVSMSSHYSLGSMKDSLTDEILLKSLNKLKQEYMIDETEGEDSPYYKAELEKAKAEAENTNDPKLWKAVVTYHDMYVKNIQEEEKFLFYWTVLIEFNLLAKIMEDIMTTLNELKEIEEELIENGILIEAINSPIKPEERYENAMKEIENLQPLDFIIFEEIRDAHRSAEKDKKEKMQELHQKEIEKNNEREEELFKEMERETDPNL